MKGVYSYKWLQSYFNDKLPAANELAEIMQEHLFEIESITQVGDDTAIEFDVVASRGIDCLGHYGFAKEIAASLGVTLNKEYFAQDKMALFAEAEDSVVTVDTPLCPRYTVSRFENCSIREIPDWMLNQLHTIGQKNISPFVDISNYALFELGHPTHAFDADKVQGALHIKEAVGGETFISLTGEEYSLVAGDMIITDDSGAVLGLAGIKGGLVAGVDESTKNILLEAATFDKARVRKTMRRLGLVTDASLRFTQGYPSDLIDYTNYRVCELFREILNVSPTYSVQKRSAAVPAHPRYTGVSVEEINRRLGTKYSQKEVADVFSRLGFDFNYISSKDELIKEARTHIGKEYSYGASVLYDAPKKFDCSSFISYCASRVGKQIPRVSINQYLSSKMVSKPSPGDLVFFVDKSPEYASIRTSRIPEAFATVDGEVEGGINHCGIITSEGMMIHASDGAGVCEVSIDDYISQKDSILLQGYREILALEEKRFAITVPVYRPDLLIKEDLIEEVGRILGYGSVSVFPPKKLSGAVANKRLAWQMKITNALNSIGFYDVLTYALQNKGKFCVCDPIAKDKACLRTSLIPGLKEAATLNANYGELLGVEAVQLFEFGVTFSQVETYNLGITTASVLGRKDSTDYVSLVKKAFKSVGIDKEIVFVEGSWETDFDSFISSLPDIQYEPLPLIGDVEYKIISKYPFVLRDISLFADADEGFVTDVICENVPCECVRISCYDRFERDGKKSYTYRLVFQSNEKTLTDEKVNVWMSALETALGNKGYVIR